MIYTEKLLQCTKPSIREDLTDLKRKLDLRKKQLQQSYKVLAKII